MALGFSVFVPASTEAIMTAVPPEKAGSASSINQLIRQVGQALGVAVCGSVAASRYTSSFSDTASGLSGAPLTVARDDHRRHRRRSRPRRYVEGCSAANGPHRVERGDADPTTGAQIYVDGTPTQIGGTSLSSPLAMGLWTRINSTHNGALGFAPPKLYGLYTKAQNGSLLPPSSVPGFHDVVLGPNGTYTATPGWDYVTGLGSWDVAALSSALK